MTNSNYSENNCELSLPQTSQYEQSIKTIINNPGISNALKKLYFIIFQYDRNTIINANIFSKYFQ